VPWIRNEASDAQPPLSHPFGRELDGPRSATKSLNLVPGSPSCGAGVPHQVTSAQSRIPGRLGRKKVIRNVSSGMYCALRLAHLRLSKTDLLSDLSPRLA